MKKVVIMVPCYNEEESLRQLHQELCAVMSPEYSWELLLVDDGSTDGTPAVMKELYESDPRVSILRLSRNYGKEKAMLAGMDYADSDALINIDADLQDPPELIPQMLKKWEEGYDDVYAHRTSRGSESWLRRVSTRAFYRLLQRISRIDMLEDVGDFRLLDRKCVDALRAMRESERYTKGLYCHIGFSKAGIDFDRADRRQGKSKMSLRRLTALAINGIVSHSSLPLRLATVLGVFISLFAFILGLYYLVKALIWGDPVSGFPTLVTIILFLGGVQLVGLGIIGEYIGRIFIETKQRPVYNVKEHHRHK